MDAFHIGAAGDHPDDKKMFEAITAQLADLDTSPIDPTPAPPERDETSPPASKLQPAAEPQRPAPAPDYDRQRPSTPEAPPASLPQPRPAPVTTAPPRRPRPHKPEAPDYWGRHGLVVVYWIAILTGAIGQVIFFGSMFNIGLGGFIAAGIIATTAETVMVSAGDTALHLRAQGRRPAQWAPFLLIAFTAATAASGMNLTHWWQDSVSMAVLFGGIAFLGFLLHIVHGFGEGTEYLAKKKKYDTELAEIEKRERAEADAEQARRELEHNQRTRTEAPANTAPSPAKKPAAKRSARPGKATKADALHIGVEQEACTPAALRAALISAGYALPASSTTVENWCREIKVRLRENR